MGMTQSRLLMLSCVIALALGQTALAYDRKGPECKSVPQCVALAEKDPSTFTPTLREQLEKLPAPVLIAGLRYQHPKPEVNERLRDVLYEALTRAEGHTPGSASALVDLAVATHSEGLREAWFRSLSMELVGRAALKQFIDSEPESPYRFAAMLEYVDQAGKPTLDDYLKDRVRIQFGPIERKLPPKLEADLLRYVDEIWQHYLKVRETKPHEASELENHMQSQREYTDRFAALLTADVAAGKLPTGHSIWVLTAMCYHRRDLGLHLLDWAESSNPDLRHVVSENMLVNLKEVGFQVDDYPRIRRILLMGAKDPKQPDRASFPYFIAKYLKGVTAEEAKELVAFINADSNDVQNRRTNEEILLRLAKPFPEYRARFIDRILHGDLQEVAQTLALRQVTPDWLADAALGWIRSLSDDALRDEATQERFLVLARAVNPGVRLPESRAVRSRSVYRCFEGPMMAYQAAVEKRDDLAAFGKPLPAKTPREQVPEAGRPGHMEDIPVPPPPPLTPQQATVRWQKFLFARDALLRAPRWKRQRRPKEDDDL